eukprot:TRINITY_DN50110_c0_g1_i1.p1 TRINITY_DN50110_c0_g1~~TRINITY_DN50110_c0_g1_i1.p1  ORF type:complete len:191 (-),score=17.77 TRINITY_DN50110_c0_g1_i1:70-621(-)
MTHPFGMVTDCTDDILSRTLECGYCFDHHFSGISQTYKSLIGELIVRSPVRRLSAAEALAHTSFTQGSVHTFAWTSRNDADVGMEGARPVRQTSARGGRGGSSSAPFQSVLTHLAQGVSFTDISEESSSGDQAASAAGRLTRSNELSHRDSKAFSRGLSGMQAIVYRYRGRRVHPEKANLRLQ